MQVSAAQREGTWNAGKDPARRRRAQRAAGAAPTQRNAPLRSPPPPPLPVERDDADEPAFRSRFELELDDALDAAERSYSWVRTCTA